VSNLLWLVLALPDWYFSSLLAPFSDGILTLVPALGALCFVAGVALGVTRRTPRLLFFAIPFMLSETLVAVAGLLRGQVQSATANPILLVFVATQLILSGALVWLIRRARLAAVLLAVFSLTYALFGIFIAGMSFANDWI
jgi:hypothetical protein